MTIIGIGTDVVQIPRIEKILNNFGDKFLLRILHPKEYQKIKTIHPDLKSNYVAKRFAAKEAISKAIGSGIALGLKFKDIAIINDNLGKPVAHFEGSMMVKFAIYQIDISLSDDYPIAVAFVVISK
jgi:holo-[acyl-carrier protein] synthase